MPAKLNSASIQLDLKDSEIKPAKLNFPSVQILTNSSSVQTDLRDSELKPAMWEGENKIND